MAPSLGRRAPRPSPTPCPVSAPAPELVWPHTHHHLTLPYLCLGGAAPSRLCLHELEGPCELCPIPHLPPQPTPMHTPLSAAPWKLGWRTGRPPTVTHHMCSREHRESGARQPPRGLPQ